MAVSRLFWIGFGAPDSDFFLIVPLEKKSRPEPHPKYLRRWDPGCAQAATGDSIGQGDWVDAPISHRFLCASFSLCFNKALWPESEIVKVFFFIVKTDTS